MESGIGTGEGDASGKAEGDAAGDVLGEAEDDAAGDVLGEAEGDAAGDVLDEAEGDTSGDVLGEAEGDAAGDVLGEAEDDTAGEDPGEAVDEAEGDTDEPLCPGTGSGFDLESTVSVGEDVVSFAAVSSAEMMHASAEELTLVSSIPSAEGDSPVSDGCCSTAAAGSEVSARAPSIIPACGAITSANAIAAQSRRFN